MVNLELYRIFKIVVEEENLKPHILFYTTANRFKEAFLWRFDQFYEMELQGK